jgi:hypothetical protein
MVDLVKSRVLAGSGLWNLPTDQRNEQIILENRARSLDKVMAESQQIHDQLVDALQTLTNADLIDPARFANMPSEWQPLRIIAENTYEHYQDHIASVRGWLGSNRQGPENHP